MKLQHISRIAKAALTRSVPVYAHFGITHRCDLTCKMCGIWRYGNEKEELSLAEMQEVARRMRRLGVVQVSIGGGEPFMRKDLEEIVKAFVGEGLNLRVLTNAVDVPEERIRKTIENGCKNFSISLDSLYPARFDYICEKEGSWDGAVKNMTLIGKLLQGTDGFPMINCVVSHLNLEELSDMAHFAREIGFGISYLPVELLSDAKDGVRNWEARFIRYRPELQIDVDANASVGARIDKAYDQVIELKRKGFPILNSTPYLEASRHYLKTGQFPAEGCDAGALYFSVAPNGQFTICHRTLHQHKHFLDPDFETYFRSEVYERIRLQEAGGCEGCMRACWIDTSSMFRTLQGFAETAWLQVKPTNRETIPWEEARRWARYDQVPIVPDASSCATAK